MKNRVNGNAYTLRIDDANDSGIVNFMCERGAELEKCEQHRVFDKGKEKIWMGMESKFSRHSVYRQFENNKPVLSICTRTYVSRFVFFLFSSVHTVRQQVFHADTISFRAVCLRFSCTLHPTVYVEEKGTLLRVAYAYDWPNLSSSSLSSSLRRR